MNFILIGAAGYVAPRHMQAIKDTGNNLIAALDIRDSVGILDRYFKDVAFFTEFERFDRHCEKIKNQIDYVSICSPNYLHDAHIRFGLRLGANVICEKPLVIKSRNLDSLKQLENNNKINCILQLRYHPELIKLKNSIDKNKNYKISLVYYTPRGNWYEYSWKGSPERSGGLLMNIGVHFFDMFNWLFGENRHYDICNISKTSASGNLIYDNANIEWSLSISKMLEPKRILKINDNEIKLEGFADLHTECYKQIIAGNGYGIEDIRPAIQLIEDLC